MEFHRFLRIPMDSKEFLRFLKDSIGILRNFSEFLGFYKDSCGVCEEFHGVSKDSLGVFENSLDSTQSRQGFLRTPVGLVGDCNLQRSTIVANVMCHACMNFLPRHHRGSSLNHTSSRSKPHPTPSNCTNYGSCCTCHVAGY
jgi:hypothetical protein